MLSVTGDTSLHLSMTVTFLQSPHNNYVALNVSLTENNRLMTDVCSAIYSFIGSNGVYLDCNEQYVLYVIMTVTSDVSYRFIVIALYVVILTVVLVDILSSSEHMYNLISGGGLIAFLMIFFVFSHDPSKVHIRQL